MATLKHVKAPSIVKNTPSPSEREQTLIDMLAVQNWVVEFENSTYSITDATGHNIDRGFRTSFTNYVVSELLFKTGYYKGLKVGRAALLSRIKEFVNELDS